MALDILLVNPNRMKPAVAPLALEYLADALERAGLTFALCDLCFAPDPQTALAVALEEHSPRLIAMTLRNSDDCYCATHHFFVPYYASLVETIRSHSEAPVVLGGAGYSTAPVGMLRRTGTDYGLVGDGEEALVELTRAVSAQAPVEGLSGLVWSEGGQWRQNPPAWREFGQEPLTRSHCDTGRYFREGGQAGLETKRGCPGGCVYCADPLSKGSRLRLRPVEAIVGEVRNLLAQGADALHLCDSEFNLSYEHARAVCEGLIAGGLGEQVRWWGYLAPSPFDAELLDLMIRSGCAGIDFGADSGDPQMLQRLGRQYTVEDLRETAQLCRSRHLPFMYDLLLGGPGETLQSVKKTVDLMKEIRPTCVGVALGMRLYRGSPAAEAVVGDLDGCRTHLLGQVADNSDLTLPVFYLQGEIASGGVRLLRDLIGDDQRFFFGWPDEAQADYNYDDNPVLVEAIAAGERGAYWDMLRRRLGLDA